jgi:hypothetical protein
MALLHSKKRQFPPFLKYFFAGFPRVFSALSRKVAEMAGKVREKGRFWGC